MTIVSRTFVVLAGTIVFTLSGGPSALLLAGSGSGDDRAGASGADALTRASAAALAATGGGRVTGTEIHDGVSCYEVEITLVNGEQLDIHLDESYHVLHWYPDVAEAGDAD